MIDINCDKISLKNAYSSTPPWTFIQLYCALDASWLQQQLQKQLTNALEKSEPKVIFLESQGFYCDPRKKTSSAPRQKFRRFKTSNNVSLRSNKRCYNCIEIFHYHWNCLKSRTMADNVKNL